MATEVGHAPGRAYIGQDGNVHLNGAAMFVAAGSKMQADDTTPFQLGVRIAQTTVDTLTAHAGGGQASATLLSADYNRITVVATIADSVVLPPSFPGMEITVSNAAANSMNVFPSAGGTGTETINGLAANAAFAVAGGKTATFFCATAGQIHSLLSA